MPDSDRDGFDCGIVGGSVPGSVLVLRLPGVTIILALPVRCDHLVVRADDCTTCNGARADPGVAVR